MQILTTRLARKNFREMYYTTKLVSYCVIAANMHCVDAVLRAASAKP